MTQQDKTLRKFIMEAELFSHMNYSDRQGKGSCV